MRFLLETGISYSDPLKNTVHIIVGDTLEDAVTTFIRNYPEGIKDKYTISEIHEAIGDYCIGAALIKMLPPAEDIPF